MTPTIEQQAAAVSASGRWRSRQEMALSPPWAGRRRSSTAWAVASSAGRRTTNCCASAESSSVSRTSRSSRPEGWWSRRSPRCGTTCRRPGPARAHVPPLDVPGSPTGRRPRGRRSRTGANGRHRGQGGHREVPACTPTEDALRITPCLGAASRDLQRDAKVCRGGVTFSCTSPLGCDHLGTASVPSPPGLACTMGRAADVLGITPAFLRAVGQARELVGHGTPVEAAGRITVTAATESRAGRGQVFHPFATRIRGDVDPPTYRVLP